MHQISDESLNGFTLNSQGGYVWSLTWKSLSVKVKGDGSEKRVFVPGQGHQGQKTKILLNQAAPDGPISRELLSGFAANSQERCVSFPSRTSFKVKV